MADDGVPNVLHESDIRAVIRDEIGGAAGQSNAPIESVDAPYTLNATFSNTEVATAVNELGVAVNLILDALRASGIIET
jgi:hypothetical protein